MIGTVIDIETTGWLKYSTASGESLLDDHSEILEVGYMRIDLDTKKIYGYGTLYFYKPYFFIESDAQRIHGLTREFLKQYEDQFMMNLVALNSLIQSTCIIGKNSNKFDVPFIKSFIKKHGGDVLDLPNVVALLDQKSYNGGKIRYNDTLYAIDLQECYKERYHDLFREKYGVICSSTKKGKLSDYIDVIPSGREAVDFVYGGMEKARETGAHGALYDCVMTYVVWCDARNNKIC